MEAIARELGRHQRTIKRFLMDPLPRKKRSDAGLVKIKTDRNLRRILRATSANQEENRGEIFDAAEMKNVPKYTRNKVFLAIRKNISPIKKPPMDAKHEKGEYIGQKKKCMKLQTKNILFNDEFFDQYQIVDLTSRVIQNILKNSRYGG